jgi:hypothetical protein
MGAGVAAKAFPAGIGNQMGRMGKIPGKTKKSAEDFFACGV